MVFGAASVLSTNKCFGAQSLLAQKEAEEEKKGKRESTLFFCFLCVPFCCSVSPRANQLTAVLVTSAGGTHTPLRSQFNFISIFMETIKRERERESERAWGCKAVLKV